MKKSILAVGLLILTSCSGAEGGTADAGRTGCPDGQTLCGSVCRSTSDDTANCGACGNACEDGYTCKDGACTSVCDAGSLFCGDTCIDPMSDPDHCGASGDCLDVAAGAVCAESEVCSNGACKSECDAGLLRCDGTCVDPETDRDHCGATDDCLATNAGSVCDATERCVDGSCVPDDVFLTGLTLSAGTLSPAFSPDATVYAVSVGIVVESIRVTPTSPLGIGIQVNGTTVGSGEPSAPIALDASEPTTVDIYVHGNTERTYHLVVTRGQPSYLKATTSITRFGCSVSLSGDTLAVGAEYFDYDLNLDAGAVYVFVRDAKGDWIPQARLVPDDGEVGDSFGHSVSLSGDRLVVGAPYSHENAAFDLVEAGKAYVYARDGSGSWHQEASLTAANRDRADLFGRSVAISGDTVVVGVPFESSAAVGVNGDSSDNSATGAGAAYVFVRGSAGIWVRQAYLKASNAEAVDFFGMSVAISGSTVVVGATGEESTATGVNGDQTDNSSADVGAAYVFERSGSTWSQRAYLKPSRAAMYDEFGSSVSISGDTIAVAAADEYGDDLHSSDYNQGAVYVFVREGTQPWRQQAKLTASNADAGDKFGTSVCVDGDALVVGAPIESSAAAGVNGEEADNSLHASGAAYLYVRDANGLWSKQAYLKSPAPGKADHFGTSVSVSQGVVAVGVPDEDGADTGVGGDPTDDSAASAGATFVY